MAGSATGSRSTGQPRRSAKANHALRLELDSFGGGGHTETKGVTRVCQALKEDDEGRRNCAGIRDIVGGILGGLTKSMSNGSGAI